jgi:hypothetical protein
MGAKSSPKRCFDIAEAAKNLANIELLARAGTLDKN